MKPRGRGRFQLLRLACCWYTTFDAGHDTRDSKTRLATLALDGFSFIPPAGPERKGVYEFDPDDPGDWPTWFDSLAALAISASVLQSFSMCCLFVHTTKAQGPSTARDFRFATNRASLGMTGWGGN